MDTSLSAGQCFLSNNGRQTSFAPHANKSTAARRRGPLCAVLSIVGLFAMPTAGLAFDVNNTQIGGPAERSEFFRNGYNAYHAGKKGRAIEEYGFAAELGHAGAQWKLARMYADGDGVPQDDYRAYQIYQRIVEIGAEPGSRNRLYVSDALVALGKYTRSGIPGSPVNANPLVSRDLFLQAASIYHNSTAQFELGQFYLTSGSGAQSMRNAARWFRAAANKGHVGAQAQLGNLLFQKGKTVRGLALMTSAMQRASDTDMNWIRPMQEQAFSVSSDDQRQAAIVMADEIAGREFDQ